MTIIETASVPQAEVQIVNGGNIAVWRVKRHAEIFDVQQNAFLLLRLRHRCRFNNCHDGAP